VSLFGFLFLNDKNLYKNLLINIHGINTKNLASFNLLIRFLCGPKVNSCKHVLRPARHSKLERAGSDN